MILLYVAVLIIAILTYLITDQYNIGVRFGISFLVFFVLTGITTYIVHWIGDNPSPGSTAVNPKDIYNPESRND